MKVSYGWKLYAQRKALITMGSLTRLNILGALSLSDIGGTVIHDYKTINEQSAILFFYLVGNG
ncbi:hypothetical protein ABK905_05520 [Acerihabitans sp. KWT182]|uniref:Uncharacterized protein n=1 Tax=Acerihabitans sp. KWT182 TaxID=3157919 RepID=A0AAU7QBV3_9GAMM